MTVAAGFGSGSGGAAAAAWADGGLADGQSWSAPRAVPLDVFAIDLPYVLLRNWK